MEVTLDKTRSYGQIWGHQSASFEQDGKLFDGAGELLVEDAPKHKKQKTEVEQVNAAHDFLTNVLDGGAVSKSSLFKMADENHVAWSDVLTEAASMNVRKYKQGSAEMWKLA